MDKPRRVRWVGGKFDESGKDSRQFGVTFPARIGRAIAGMEFHVEVRDDEIALVPVGAPAKKRSEPALDPAAVVLAQRFRALADEDEGRAVVDDTTDKIALT
jgi:hypothetical protein